MAFARFLKEYIKDEGYSEDDVWNMSLSQYNRLKKEARADYDKQNQITDGL